MQKADAFFWLFLQSDGKGGVGILYGAHLKRHEKSFLKDI